MAPFIYYLLLICLMVTGNPEKSGDTVLCDMGDTTTTGVGLGRKKKNCRGKGICVIGSDLKIAASDDQMTIARLGFTDQSFRNMFISYSDLSKYAVEKYFSDKYFVMEEAFAGFVTIKGRDYKIHIPKGEYPIHREDKGLRIVFD